jgi:uncharacterized protein (TIGR03067 family)
MKARLLCLLITAMLAGGAVGQQEKTDDKLKGTWLVVEVKGEFAEKLKGGTFTFGDGTGAMSGPRKDDRGDKFTYKVEPTKKPKELDLIVGDGDKKGIVKAIYAIDGDTMKLCFAPDPGSDRKRPTEFKDDGKDSVLIGLKRQKP